MPWSDQNRRVELAAKLKSALESEMRVDTRPPLTGMRLRELPESVSSLKRIPPPGGRDSHLTCLMALEDRGVGAGTPVEAATMNAIPVSSYQKIRLVPRSTTNLPIQSADPE